MLPNLTNQFINLVFCLKRYNAHFSVVFLSILVQSPRFRNNIWIIITYWHLISKTGSFEKFVYFHFDIWKNRFEFCGKYKKIRQMFARNAKMPKILLPSSSGISGNAINIGCYIFNKCKHQNKNGLRKIPYKIKWQ